MSRYFRNFPTVPYSFGNGLELTLFNNLSVYIDLLDQVKDAGTWYNYYNIQEWERPDTVSHTLYGSTNYHWTFFLLNDHLRESGWPVATTQVYELAQKYYPNWVLTTEDEMSEIFTVGTEITGAISGSVATVIERNLDMGQLVVSGPDNFSDTEQIYYYDPSIDALRTITLVKQARQYDAIHHYEDASGAHVDIDPFDQTSGALLTSVTYTERLLRRNDELKRIKVLTPDTARQVSGEFNRLLTGL